MAKRHLLTKNIRVIETALRCMGIRKQGSGRTGENVIDSGFPDVVIPKQTLPEFFEPFFDKFDKITAIECSETKRKYTYGEIKRKSDNVALVFRKILKFRDGDVVAVVLPNIPEYPIATFSILKANMVITTINPAYTSDEICRQLQDSDAKVVITDFFNYTKVRECAKKMSKNLSILMVKTRNGQELPNGAVDFHELMNAEAGKFDLKPGSPDNLAILPYSSGTTGLPKGVQLTHKNLVSNIYQHNQSEVQYLIEASGDDQEVIPITLPFYHAYGLNFVLNNSIFYGAKIVTLEKFNPIAYPTMLKEYQNSTIIFGVPPLVILLINNDNIKKEYLKNVRFLMSGAAPLSKLDEQRFYQKFGDNKLLLQGYGLTECTALSCFTYPNKVKGPKENEGSVGIPIINTKIKIRPLENSDIPSCGSSESGEVCIKGPQVMKGYLNRPEETKQCLTDDGWLLTGDVGHYNKNGCLFITDRIKEFIKVNAFQVAPAELEAVLRSYPGVLEAAVIGVPHKSFGEVPRAYVLPKNGVNLNAKTLNEYVSGRVAKYKKLEGGVVFVDEIPKSPSGKILRRVLKEEFLKS